MHKRKPQAGDTAKRVFACEEFAIQPKKYRSIEHYVRKKRIETEEGDWALSKSQMQRYMMRTYGQGL